MDGDTQEIYKFVLMVVWSYVNFDELFLRQSQVTKYHMF